MVLENVAQARPRRLAAVKGVKGELSITYHVRCQRRPLTENTVSFTFQTQSAV